MRRTSESVIARQAAVAQARAEALADRMARLVALAPTAEHAHLRYLAVHCGTLPTFPTILAVLRTLSHSGD